MNFITQTQLPENRISQQSGMQYHNMHQLVRDQHNPAVENVADYLLAGYQKYISTFFFEFNNNILYFTFKLILVFLNQ